MAATKDNTHECIRIVVGEQYNKSRVGFLILPCFFALNNERLAKIAIVR